jgi:hypothetical protein
MYLLRSKIQIYGHHFNETKRLVKDNKMKEYLELGSAPADEDCIQVGDNDYVPAMLKDCKRYKEQLTKQFLNIPDSCSFSIKQFPHDFGSYYEVVIYYDPNIPASIDFAFNVENNLPNNWLP